MNHETFREFCLSLPDVTEKVQWGNDLLFLIGGKMFAVMNLEATGSTLVSFKCMPERFAELIEMDDIIPAPYMARNHWVALQRFGALPERELRELVTKSYDLVYARLPKKLRETLSTLK